MRISRLVLLLGVVGVVGVVSSERVIGGQATAGRATSAAPALRTKMMDWPTPATSAAGFPAPWNLIQASSVAVTARGTILVLRRGAPNPGIREQRQAHPLLGRPAVRHGRGRA